MDYSDIIEHRKYFHQHPELSGEEKNTSEKVLEILGDFRPDNIVSGIGGHGIIATYFSENPGPTRLFRAEMDALPIQEVNNLEYASAIAGVSHKCGHDGHLSTLLGLAKKLHKHPIESGTVHLLFQPAEETGEGARLVMSDSKFNEINPDYVFAYHNVPGYALGDIVVKEGSFSASVVSMIMKFEGETAHASEPEHGVNPALVISKVIQSISLLENNDIKHPNFNVITPVHINLGEVSYGVSAGYGELHLTIRTWTKEELDQLTHLIKERTHHIAQAHQVKLTTSFVEEFQSNKCHAEAVGLIRKASEICGYNLHIKQYPFKWGEDFGLFTQQFKGAMFGIGSGTDSPALHNSDYDFPDDLIPVGTQLFYELIKLTNK